MLSVPRSLAIWTIESSAARGRYSMAQGLPLDGFAAKSRRRHWREPRIRSAVTSIRRGRLRRSVSGGRGRVLRTGSSLRAGIGGHLAEIDGVAPGAATWRRKVNSRDDRCGSVGRESRRRSTPRPDPTGPARITGGRNPTEVTRAAAGRRAGTRYRAGAHRSERPGPSRGLREGPEPRRCRPSRDGGAFDPAGPGAETRLHLFAGPRLSSGRTWR